jgi:excisionase family DNA binding protein
VYTAQTVADFCEVDLKTVHHWADRGKVPHFRTDGRHLRFRRNDIVRFLRAHGYPLPEALVRARPTVALALASAALEGGALSLDELAKRLTSRFSVRRHTSGVAAVAHLVAESPDVLVVSWGDPTIGLPSAIAALKEDPATSWIAIATVGSTDALAAHAGEGTGADIMLTPQDIARLPGELARTLAVNT